MRSPVSIIGAVLIYLALMFALGGAAISAGLGQVRESAPQHVIVGGQR